MLAAALVVLIVALAPVALVFYSRRIPVRDQRLTPSPVRVSFGICASVLIAASTALLLRASHLFPWPLRSDTSDIVGCILLGNAVYFLYGLSARYWGEAIGQLIAFTAYDLVLIGPFLHHLNRVLPEHWLSLLLYIIVLIGSGGLRIYYLLLAPAPECGARLASAPTQCERKVCRRQVTSGLRARQQYRRGRRTACTGSRLHGVNSVRA